MWIETASLALKAADVGIKAASASERLKNAIFRLKSRGLDGTMTMPVFGCGGAGKTTFGRIVLGEEVPVILKRLVHTASQYREHADGDFTDLFEYDLRIIEAEAALRNAANIKKAIRLPFPVPSLMRIE